MMEERPDWKPVVRDVEMERAVVELRNAGTSWYRIGRDPRVNRSPARAKAIFLRWEAEQSALA
jgi:hypothetical protein